MQILFSATIEPSGNKTLTVPYGVKRAKFRSNAKVPVLVGIGPISSGAMNTIQDIEFPLVNGSSPNTFTASVDGTEKSSFIVWYRRLVAHQTRIILPGR